MLSYAFVPANRHDSVIAPSLLCSSEELGLGVSYTLGGATYGSREIRETAESLGIQIITAINKRNGMRKDVYGRTILSSNCHGFSSFQSTKQD